MASTDRGSRYHHLLNGPCDDVLASTSHTAFQQNRLGIDFGRLLCCANNLQMTTAATFKELACVAVHQHLAVGVVQVPSAAKRD